MGAKRKRFALMMAGVICVLATVIVARPSQGSSGSSNSQSVTSNDLAGTWIDDMTIEGLAGQTLATFAADGTMVASARRPDTSAGFGTWVHPGAHQFAYTIVCYQFNVVLSPGLPAFTATLRFQGTLTYEKSSDELSDLFKVEAFDPAGNLIFSANGTGKARRVVVETPQ